MVCIIESSNISYLNLWWHVICIISTKYHKEGNKQILYQKYDVLWEKLFVVKCVYYVLIDRGSYLRTILYDRAGMYISILLRLYVSRPQPQFFSLYFKEELDLFDIIISAQKEQIIRNINFRFWFDGLYVRIRYHVRFNDCR